MQPYSWALDRTPAREFENMAPHVRRQIYDFLDSLARHPFQEGHMRYRDQAGFEFRICFLGDLDVHYRWDHAVREIRVAAIEQHPSLES
jgi:hypothetical protein